MGIALSRTCYLGDFLYLGVALLESSFLVRGLVFGGVALTEMCIIFIMPPLNDRLLHRLVPSVNCHRGCLLSQRPACSGTLSVACSRFCFPGTCFLSGTDFLGNLLSVLCFIRLVLLGNLL